MTANSQPASPTALFKMLAQYNQVMNQQILDACAKLPNEALLQDMGAFFGSIMGTLNHLVNADELWLSRLLDRPHAVSALNEIRFSNLKTFGEMRAKLDQDLLAYVDALSDQHLHQPLRYTSLAANQTREESLHKVLLHLFNHQTHHRGQVTTLLFQKKVDPGVTDLVFLV
ncbi:DinB family protein [Limnobacter litoralis]|nr:DinB family protein [Limnobacter litoralis]